MKMFVTLLFGIPLIVGTVAILMPFLFIGLVLAGVISIIMQIRAERKIDPKKVLREIEDAIGWNK